MKITTTVKMMRMYLLVMISTVDTTHIGARSPGPDTEVGICNEALQKHRNIINNIIKIYMQ